MTRGVPAKEGDISVSNGYTYVKTGGKWVAKHKLVVEEKLGRALAGNEYIKFVDGDPANISPDNLVVLERKTPTSERIKTLKRRIARLQEELSILEREESGQ